MTLDANSTEFASTISITPLRLICDGLQRLSAPWESILLSCEIEVEYLKDPEARIPIEHFHRVLPSAAAITGNPGVGLQVGGVVSPHAVNLIGYLLMSSSTLGEGVARQANSDIQVH